MCNTVGEDAWLLGAAAWLHDIGYFPELARTGLHGVDGARYLRDVQHAAPMLCRLVAHHSCAVTEAEERGLADLLHREFALPPQPLADALTLCDMTTGPDAGRSTCAAAWPRSTTGTAPVTWSAARSAAPPRRSSRPSARSAPAKRRP